MLAAEPAPGPNRGISPSTAPKPRAASPCRPRHSRRFLSVIPAPFSRHSRPRAGICPERPPTPVHISRHTRDHPSSYPPSGSVIPALVAEPAPGSNRGISPSTAPRPRTAIHPPLSFPRHFRHTHTPPPPSPRPTSVIPALCRGYLAASAPDAPNRLLPSFPRPLFRHTRALPRVSRRQRSRRPKPPLPVIPAPGSVAPNLIWGPYGGCWRDGVPSGPANGVGWTTRGFCAAKRVGYAPLFEPRAGSATERGYDGGAATAGGG